MGLGLAFTDVVVDALMVEHGQRWQLTGAFQGVQWAAIESASVLVGVGGGALTVRGALRVAFLLAALCPLLSGAVAAFALPETRVAWQAGQVRGRHPGSQGWRDDQRAFSRGFCYYDSRQIRQWYFSAACRDASGHCAACRLDISRGPG
jgi:MFS family permease